MKCYTCKNGILQIEDLHFVICFSSGRQSVRCNSFSRRSHQSFGINAYRSSRALHTATTREPGKRKGVVGNAEDTVFPESDARGGDRRGSWSMDPEERTPPSRRCTRPEWRSIARFPSSLAWTSLVCGSDAALLMYACCWPRDPPF